jgi:hypothetical protein
MSDPTEQLPEFPDHLLDQVLADPEARAALSDFAKRQQIDTLLEDMDRQQLRLLAGALVAEARDHQDRTGPAGVQAAALELPNALIEEVFKDPRAEPLLKDMAAANGWQQSPADLPDDVKRAFVQLLIEQGIITFEEPHADT